MEKENMTAWQLANKITEIRRKDVNAWANPYSEELCRRCRLKTAYRKNPEETVKEAGRRYGICIF